MVDMTIKLKFAINVNTKQLFTDTIFNWKVSYLNIRGGGEGLGDGGVCVIFIILLLYFP